MQTQTRGKDALLASPLAKWVLAATILASSMAFIDGTAVTVALPALQAGFRADANEIQWVIEAYALFLASLLLVGGSLGDRYGRRMVFAIGVALFALGSGPVRGFAVVFILGILTTVITAVTLTRMLIALWYRWARPKTLPF